MGSSSSQTIGYKYYMGLHFGITIAADAVLELVAGGRTAWQGEVTSSGQITIDAPELFGGDEREGGLAGTLDLMFGGPTQGVNAYLEGQQGSPQPAYRHFLGAVYRGQIAALNPYIKPWAWRVRSITKGWFGGECWYGQHAAIPVTIGDIPMSYDAFWKYQVEPAGSVADYSAANYDDTAWPAAMGGFGSIGALAAHGQEPGVVIESGDGKSIWLRGTVQGTPGEPVDVTVWHDDGAWLFWNGQLISGSTTTAPHSPDAGSSIITMPPNGEVLTIPGHLVQTLNSIALQVIDSYPYGDPSAIWASMTVDSMTGGRQGMNPAHIIYQCLTDPDWGMGYPSATIDDADFQAAADTLFAEGFGLCLKWTNQSSIGEFCQIVADHAGLNIAQDRSTGLFRLVLLRDDYDIEDLPVFTKSQVRVVKAQRPSLADTINEVIIKYRDTVTGKEAATAPLQNLANIQGQGRVVSQTLRFDGIPTHDLAVRVGMRELRAKSTPLWRMSLEFQRGEASSLLPGKPFVVDLLDTELGVKLVLRAGEISYGSAADGKITMECAEDVFALPASTYLVEQPTGWQPPNTTPQPATATTFEVPYRELVQTLSAADLAALPDDAGYLAAAAVRPSGTSLNFALRTRMGADPYEQVGIGDFAPSCLLTAACPIAHGPTTLAVDAGMDLEDLAVGTAAWLGEGAGAELVRIDAIDTVAGSVTVGRGCGDTTPHAWPIGTRLWGFDNYAAADAAQYIDAEVVDAKVLPRTIAGELAEADATPIPVTITSRQARPYVPGKFLLTGSDGIAAAYPAEVYGAIGASWAHRDRTLQSDQLVDAADADVGPESGVTYTIRWYSPADTLQSTESGITGTEATPFTPATSPSAVRVEIEAVRGLYSSWQVIEHEFHWAALPPATRITEPGDRRITEAGDIRITE
jgi:hypothetical protein